jgi:ATP-dependent DNA helicase DinG
MALQEADIVVTNHDLVLSDLALGGGAILPAPEDSIYIFDEGHHLPDKALNHFASFCRVPSTLSWLQDSRKALAKGAQLLSLVPGLDAVLEPLPALLDDLQIAMERVAEQVRRCSTRREGTVSSCAFRWRAAPEDLTRAAEALAAQWSRLAARLATLDAGIDDALDDEDFASQRDELEAWQMAVGGMLVRAEGVLSLWRDFAADASRRVAAAGALAPAPCRR